MANCWKNEVTRDVIIYFLKNRGDLFHKNSLEFDQSSDPNGDLSLLYYEGRSNSG